MATPTYYELSDPTQGGPGFVPEPWDARLLTILAILASGQNPDGTPYTGGGGGGGPTGPAGGALGGTYPNPTITITVGDVTGTLTGGTGLTLQDTANVQSIIAENAPTFVIGLTADNGASGQDGVLQTALNAIAATGGGKVRVAAASSGYGFNNPVTIPTGIDFDCSGLYRSSNIGGNPPTVGNWKGTAFVTANAWTQNAATALFNVSQGAAIRNCTVSAGASVNGSGTSPQAAWCINLAGKGAIVENVSAYGALAECIHDSGGEVSQGSQLSKVYAINFWNPTNGGTCTYIQNAVYHNTGFAADGSFAGSTGPTFQLPGVWNNYGTAGSAILDYQNSGNQIPNTIYASANPVFNGNNTTPFTYVTVNASCTFTTGSILMTQGYGLRVASSDWIITQWHGQYAGVIMQGADINACASHFSEPRSNPGPNAVTIVSGSGTTYVVSDTRGILPGSPVIDSGDAIPQGTWVQSVNQSTNTIVLNQSVTPSGTLSFYSAPSVIYASGQSNGWAGITLDSGSGVPAHILRIRGSLTISGGLIEQGINNSGGTPANQWCWVLDPCIVQSGVNGCRFGIMTTPAKSVVGYYAWYNYLGGTANGNDAVIGCSMPATGSGGIGGTALANLSVGATFTGISRGNTLAGAIIFENPPTNGITSGDVAITAGVSEVVGFESVPYVGSAPNANGDAITTDKQTQTGTWSIAGNISLPSLANLRSGQLVTSSVGGAFTALAAISRINNSAGTITVSPAPSISSTNITSTPASWTGAVGQFPNADAATFTVGALISGPGITSPAVISAIGSPGGSNTPVTITATTSGTLTGVVTTGSLAASPYTIASSTITTIGLWRSSIGTVDATRLTANFTGVQIQSLQLVGLNNNGPPTWQCPGVTVTPFPSGTTVNGVACLGTLTLPASSPYSSASLSGNQPISDSILLSPTPGNAWIAPGTVIPSGAISGTTIGLSLLPTGTGSDTILFGSTGFYQAGDRCYDPNTFTFWRTNGQQASALAPVDWTNDRTSSLTVTTPTLTSGTAAQIDLIADSVVYTDITAGGTLSVAIGPTSSTTHTLFTTVTVTTATAFPTIAVPGGWFVKFTAAGGATYTTTAVIQ